MENYIEKINRFVVEYHEELPEEHKAQMRLNGINPDDYWNLEWSFETEDAAIKQKESNEIQYVKFCGDYGYKPQKTYRVRDLGETKYIERSVWF